MALGTTSPLGLFKRSLAGQSTLTGKNPGQRAAAQACTEASVLQAFLIHQRFVEQPEDGFAPYVRRLPHRFSALAGGHFRWEYVGGGQTHFFLLFVLANLLNFQIFGDFCVAFFFFQTTGFSSSIGMI